MTTLLIIIHVLVCLFLVAIVLLQHGKGADIGATFGGSSQSLFGSEGPVPLLNKITTFSAIVFMGTSVTLAYLSAHKSGGTVMSDIPAKEAAAPVQKEKPVTIPMPTTTEQPAAETSETEKKAAEPVPAKPAPTAQQEQQQPETVPAETDSAASSVAQKEQAQVEQPQLDKKDVKSEPSSAVQQNENEAPAAEQKQKPVTE
jgi:preprotein translocase subunit SecG